MFDNLSLILGLISSILSIIGFIVAIFKHQKLLIRILFLLVMVLSASTVYFGYQYKKQVDEIVDLNLRKNAAKKDAVELLDKLPSYASSVDPGKAQGIVYSVLRFLENHQTLFPDTYKNYKSEVIDKLKRVNSENYSEEYDKQLEIAGETALTFLNSIAE